MQIPTVNTIIGGGAAGSDRLELFWPNNAVKNAWLQVEVLPNADTGLADLGGSYAGIGDIFYFANKAGDTGNDNGGSYIITSADTTQVRLHPGLGVPVDYLYDINKDGNITSADTTQVRLNAGQLPWIDVSSGGPLAPASGGSSSNGDSGVSSGLASTSSGGSSNWVAGRLASMGDLNTGSAASYFQSLASSGTAEAVAMLVAADAEADNLGLDDELLDSRLAERRAE